MIGWIIFIIICVILTYFITKYVTEQQKWGTKKANLERKYFEKISELEKNLIEKDKEIISKIKGMQINHEKGIKEIQIKHQQYLTELEKKFIESVKGFRKDAVLRSRSSIMGKLWEHVAPYLPKFNYHPSDMKFIGAPIDYIVFKGMNDKDINEVIFLEVKSGKSALNTQERKLKKVIEAKKVRWEEFRIDEITSAKVEENKDFEKDFKIELDRMKDNIKEDTEKEIEESKVG